MKSSCSEEEEQAAPVQVQHEEGQRVPVGLGQLCDGLVEDGSTVVFIRQL